MTRFEPKQPVVFSDLDGTLLDHGRRLSQRNHDTLMQLGAQGVARVIVTGRSRFSTTRVMDQDFPIDYLVTSSGAGIYDFRHDTLLFSDHLAPEQVQRAVQTLIGLDLDFMIQEQVPNNHHFSFHATNNHNPDFERRLKLYEGYGRALDPATRNFRESTQLLAICPPTEGRPVQQLLRDSLPDMTVIRTTSPLDHESTWFEIFPTTVSKSCAAKWLCETRSLDPDSAMMVGNDYNDLDILDWAPHRFVVANAAPDLTRSYPVVRSNDDAGFTEAVERWEKVTRQHP